MSNQDKNRTMLEAIADTAKTIVKGNPTLVCLLIVVGSFLYYMDRGDSRDSGMEELHIDTMVQLRVTMESQRESNVEMINLIKSHMEKHCGEEE